jgi:hypothetical protein
MLSSSKLGIAGGDIFWTTKNLDIIPDKVTSLCTLMRLPFTVSGKAVCVATRSLSWMPVKKILTA